MSLTKAVFPVAGLGTRSLPATKALPKEMLPIVDKPLIQYAVEEAYAAGVREMIFVTGRHKRAIEDHFDTTFELEVALEQAGKQQLLDVVRAVKPHDMHCFFVRQAQALGLGHAVLCARNLIGNHPFAVLLPDDLMIGTPPVLAQMVAQFEALKGSIIAVQEVPSEHTRRYGIVAGTAVNERVMDIAKIVEKPAPEVAPSRQAVIGRYILQPEVMRVLDAGERGAGGEIQLTDAMARMIGQQPFHALKVSAVRHDCGDKLGFVLANLALALDRPDLAPKLRERLAELGR